MWKGTPDPGPEKQDTQVLNTQTNRVLDLYYAFICSTEEMSQVTPPANNGMPYTIMASELQSNLSKGPSEEGANYLYTKDVLKTKISLCTRN